MKTLKKENKILYNQQMHKETVIIVEDNPVYRTLVKGILSNTYEVYEYESISSARNSILSLRPQSIILDIGFSEENGIAFCSELKSNVNTSDIPILFLSSIKNIENKVAGFESGADDYMVKPIEPQELLARVKLSISRAKTKNEYSVNGIKVDLKNSKVFLNGEEQISLTPTEFKILNLLLQNISLPQSREVIMKTIWGEETHVTDRTVDTHIHSLRKKLGEYGNNIKSVFGEGYSYVEAKK